MLHAREAIRLRPNDPELHLNLGGLLYGQGQLDEAAGSFRTAIRLSPAYAEAHNNLGWILKDQGHLTDALAHFRQAVRAQPGSTTPMIGLAWLLATHPDAQMRDASEAIRLGERLVELSAYQNWMSLDTLAAAYAAAGRYDDASKVAKKALARVQSISPPDASAVRERLMLYQQGKPYRESAKP